VAVGCLVGLSRVALGVHFASDVAAGWCVGLAWLSLCLLARDLLGGAAAPPRDRNPRPADVV
jgi:undecaprenyl-diphosphatase